MHKNESHKEKEVGEKHALHRAIISKNYLKWLMTRRNKSNPPEMQRKMRVSQ